MLTATLVIDEDGCYDPADFNDGLLLGLKGTMAQAELHFLRGRLQGGKLNKAKKGELRFRLPVGYCYDEQGRINPDADAEVRGACRNGVSPVSRNGQRLCWSYIASRKKAYDFLSEHTAGRGSARLSGAGLEATAACCVLLKNPSYAGNLCLRPLPVSALRSTSMAKFETNAGG